VEGVGPAMINDTLIRTAQPGDARTIARIHVDSWRSVYKSILPGFYLTRLNHGQIFQAVRRGLMAPEFIYLMAEDSRGTPMGYICGGPERSGHQIYHSEVYELYISPAFQRRGAGRQLLSTLASRLYERDYYALLVWVLASNPNHRFYEKTGGLYLGARTISFAGKKLKAAAYGWIDITMAFMDDRA
jgi:GNAT superfamily N-acetyltransferase